MDYERGLEQIIRQARGTDWFKECALYEARLRDNLNEARRYGTTEQLRSNRAQIIEQLNRLAHEQLKVSFVDLCMNKTIYQHMEATYRPDILQEQSGSDILVEDGPASEVILEELRQLSPVKVFVGSSHKDRSYLEELRIHLTPYIRTNKVACWDDAEIYPGAMWREEIKAALQAASMAVLLLSAHFLASDFIASHVLPELLASAKSEKMTLLSVIVRPCPFKDTDLVQFVPVNLPTKPLSKMRSSERDEVWMKVVECIRRAP